MIDILRGGLAVVFLLSFAIFIHELGHYLFAKLFRVKVETFSIGFGKKIWKFKRGDTEYCISAIPLGGYVKMVGIHSQEMEKIISGEQPASASDEAAAELAAAELAAPAPVSLGQGIVNEVDALRSKAWWQKFLVFSAGCINNFLTAVCVIFLMDWIGHYQSPPTPPIIEALDFVDASRAGVQAGDKVLSVAGKPVKDYSGIFVEYEKVLESKNPPANVPLEVERNGTTTTIQLPAAPPVDQPLPAGELVQIDGVKAGSQSARLRLVGSKLSAFSTGPVSVLVKTPDGKDVQTSVSLLAVLGKDWPDAAFSPRQPAFVAQPIPNLPAEKAGMRLGDEILTINGTPIRSAYHATRIIRSMPGQNVTMDIRRGTPKSGYTTETVQLEVRSNPENAAIGQIGVAFGGGHPTEFVKLPFSKALPGAFVTAFHFGERYIFGIADLLKSSFQTIRENVGGPVMIGTMAYKAANQGWQYYLYLFITFNIILAITNLLPLPVFDGGHILFSTVEAIIRRPLPAKFMLFVYNTFTVLIIGLALAITFNDVIMNWWRVR